MAPNNSRVNFRHGLSGALRLYTGLLFCAMQLSLAAQTVGLKTTVDDKVSQPVLPPERQSLLALMNKAREDQTSATAHIQLSRELIEVGAGAMARREAAAAVQLNPANKEALMNQAHILSFDLFGNFVYPGYDRAGAIAAYEAALKVDPDDAHTRRLLGLAYARDTNGDLFMAPDLDKAVNMFHWLVMDALENDPEKIAEDRDLLARALMYSHQYGDLRQVAQDLPLTNPMRSKYLIIAATGLKDSAAGVEEAGSLAAEPERSHNLLLAGSTLIEMGLLRQAAELDQAATVVSDRDSLIEPRRIALLQRATPVSPELPPINSPESLLYAYVYRMLVGTSDPSDFAAVLSSHSTADKLAFEQKLLRLRFESGSLYVAARDSKALPHQMLNMNLGGAQILSRGTDSTGYAVEYRTGGLPPRHYFVVREDNSYRIAALENDDDAVGHYALYALAHHQQALADAILNWKRRLASTRNTSNPLDDPPFLQLWTVQDNEGSSSPTAVRAAAISLLTPSKEATHFYDSLASRQATATRSDRTSLDLLLATGYLGAEEPARAFPYLRELLNKYPDSVRALNLARILYAEEKNLEPFHTLLTQQLRLHPNDAGLLRLKTLLLAAEHDYAGARSTIRQVIDSDKPTSGDYNTYAWLGMFDERLTPDVFDAAQQAVLLTRSTQFGSLHTLACLFAARGNTTAARQALKQAMTAGRFHEPNSDIWFTLGLLYEDYGLKDAALDAYRRVKIDDWNNLTIELNPESTYLLAQQRIQNLNGTAAKGR